MTTTISNNGDRQVVTLVGQLDTLAAVETEKALQPVFESTATDVLIDCKDLEYIASSGLRLFLALLKAVKARGGKVTLQDVNDDILNVFKVTGFNSLFDFA